MSTKDPRRGRGAGRSAAQAASAVPPGGTTSGSSSPGDRLLSLLRQIRLTGREQQIVLAVLLAQRPLTTRAVAKHTRLHYSHAKAVVRTLIAWGILTRTPQGLRFQIVGDNGDQRW